MKKKADLRQKINELEHKYMSQGMCECSAREAAWVDALKSIGLVENVHADRCIEDVKCNRLCNGSLHNSIHDSF
ncbi:hypothetical protein FACS1894190_07230 [Spirochaetia bacterium]|nr:hypothetical protein FACS1894190_07230 [Spirochaetia bacterium]